MARASGSLREDLYFRLAGIEIAVPPLRERLADLPALAELLLEDHAARLGVTPPAFSRSAIARLAEHPWSGNVRELEAVLIRLLVIGAPPDDVSDLLTPPLVEPGEALRATSGATPGPTFDAERLVGRDIAELHRELDRIYLERSFLDTGGDLSRMAEALGVKLSNLYDWLKRSGLDIRELRRRL